MGKKRTNPKATTTSAPTISPGMDYHDIQKTDPAPDLSSCSCNCSCKEMLKEMREIRDSTIRARDIVTNSLDPIHKSQADHHSKVLEALKGFTYANETMEKLETQTRITEELEIKVEKLKNTLHFRIAAIDTAFEKVQKLASLQLTKPSSDPFPVSHEHEIYDVNVLQTKINSISRELRANNVVIHGIPHDTEQQTHTQALDFLKRNLNLTLQILESKRLGKSTTEHPAPLLLKFPSRLEKLQIFKRCHLLKGTQISVQDDLCDDDRAERKRKVPTFKELKSQNKNVQFRGPDLYVDNILHPC
jgi:hypothetical protein